MDVYNFDETCALQPSNLFAFGAQYFAEKRSQTTAEVKKDEQEVATAEQRPSRAF